MASFALFLLQALLEGLPALMLRFVTILATQRMGFVDMTVLQRVIGRIGTSDPSEGAKDISES